MNKRNTKQRTLIKATKNKREQTKKQKNDNRTETRKINNKRK